MNPMNYVIVDLMFGDSGKGTCTDYLCREKNADLVVRYNGGAQARHHVVHGKLEHGFAQFGSGTFAEVPTLLSKFMLVNPLTMGVEAKMLIKLGLDEEKLWANMFVSEGCRITTPYHRALNRLREMCRGNARHGSCGMGVGETVADSIQYPKETIYAGDLKHHKSKELKTLLENCQFRCLNTIKKLDGIETAEKTELGKRELSTFEVPIGILLDGYREWAESVNVLDQDGINKLLQKETVIYEGAQGVLLDELHGFHPYTTWSGCTQLNALDLLQEARRDDTTTIGVIRPYATRHGAGPFPTYDYTLTQKLMDKHNGTGEYQGEFRVGWLDLVALRYALACCRDGVDWLALTNIDRLGEVKHWQYCNSYEPAFELSIPTSMKEQMAQTKLMESAKPVYSRKENLDEILLSELGLKIGLISFGPGSHEKKMANDIEVLVKTLPDLNLTAEPIAFSA